MKVQKPILKMKQKPNLVKKRDISKEELKMLELEADLADMMLSQLILETAKLFKEIK